MRPSQNRFRLQCTPSVEPLPRTGRNRSRIQSKYDNVKAAIDSGLNMLKVNEKFPESKVNARFKKQEFFRRMNPSTLVRLINEGEVDCLILDVRDHEAYLTCHLKDAVSFPAPFLRRSVNVFSLEILSFINKEPKKIIVFYDDNGLSALSTGNLFAEKGVDNIFMLNGGLKEMALKHPELTEGRLETQSSYFSGTPTPSVKSDPYTSAGYSAKRRWCRPSSSSVALIGKH